jgi:hypothetical protein
MRFILGVILAAVAAFFYGYFFWSQIGYPKTVIKSLPSQESLVPAMQAAIPETGVYMVPSYEDKEQSMTATQPGPIAMIMYQAEDGAAMKEVMTKGFLHMLGSAFLLAIVVATAGRRSFFGRLMLVFWVGLFLSIWTQMGNNIWWFFPIKWSCLQMTYHLTSITIMGVVLAFFVRPPADPTMD